MSRLAAVRSRDVERRTVPRRRPRHAETSPSSDYCEGSRAVSPPEAFFHESWQWTELTRRMCPTVSLPLSFGNASACSEHAGGLSSVTSFSSTLRLYVANHFYREYPRVGYVDPHSRFVLVVAKTGRRKARATRAKARSCDSAVASDGAYAPDLARQGSRSDELPAARADRTTLPWRSFAARPG